MAIRDLGLTPVAPPSDGRNVTSPTTYLGNNAVFSPLDFRSAAITTGAAMLQAAVDAARSVGGVVELNEAQLVLTQPIDLTKVHGDARLSITIRQKGTTRFEAPTLPALQVMHNGHVFDCAGSEGLIFENINVGVVGGFLPLTCWFFARNAAGDGCGDHQLDNCRGWGTYAKAVVYSYGSEVNQFKMCRFSNAAANPVVFKWTAGNIDGLTSTFIAIAAGAQSNIVSYVDGGEFWAFAAGGKVFYLDRHIGCTIKDFWYVSGDGASGHGHSMCYVDQSLGVSDRLSIEGALGESASLPQFGVYLSDAGALRSPTYVSIRRCRMGNTVNAIKADGAQTRALLWTIEDIDEDGANLGCAFPGTLDTATYNSTTKLNVGTLVNPKMMRIPQAALTAAQFRGGQFAFEEGNLQINGQTLAVGLIGAGGVGVVALGIGAQPATVGTLAQLFVDGAGNLKCVTPGGNVRTVAAV